MITIPEIKHKQILMRIDSTIYEIEGVTKIGYEFAGSVANVQGIAKSIFQPWYFKPVKISIDGNTYIGTYKDDDGDTNLRGGNTVTNFLELMQKLNNYYKSGSDKYLELQITDDKNDYCFNCYIENFRFDDEVDNPFMYSYSIELIGISSIFEVYNTAQNNFKEDANKIVTF